jgi:hypothetical protein
MSKYSEKLEAVNRVLNSSDREKEIVNSFFQEARKKMASNVVKNISSSSDFSFDSFLGGDVVKIASLDDLFSFERVASNTLIHKSSKELWSIDIDEEGQTYIAKLFDGKGSPLKV